MKQSGEMGRCKIPIIPGGELYLCEQRYQKHRERESFEKHEILSHVCIGAGRGYGEIKIDPTCKFTCDRDRDPNGVTFNARRVIETTVGDNPEDTDTPAGDVDALFV